MLRRRNIAMTCQLLDFFDGRSVLQSVRDCRFPQTVHADSARAEPLRVDAGFARVLIDDGQNGTSCKV